MMKRDMSDTPANTSLPNSSSGMKFVTVDELQKLEKRLMTTITPVEARSSWQEDEPSPFSVNILSGQMPPNFIEPLLDNYTGRTDPFYHIAQFEAAASLKNLTGQQKCLLLRATLKEAALQWFSNLPVGSITNYIDFKKQLLARFVSAKKRLREPMTLFNIIQGPTESLQSYVDRFLQATIDIHNFDPNIVQSALIGGLRDETFRFPLRINPPKSYDHLLDTLSHFINMSASHSIPSTDRSISSEEEEKHLADSDTSREKSFTPQTVFTVFVKGFDRRLGLVEIQRKLQEHFGSCGKITHISLPKRYPGVSKGFGFIDFEDYNAFAMALRLDGSALGGYALTVQEEIPRRP